MPYTLTDLINGDLFELVAYCQDNEQVAVNVLHIACTATDTSNLDMQDLVDDYELTFRPLYSALLTSGSFFRGLTLRRLRSARSATFYSSHVATAGTIMAPLLPRQCAGLIKMTANVAGRRGRGRMYVPFPNEDANDLGTPNAAYRALMQDLADAVNTPHDHADIDGIHNNQFTTVIRHVNGAGPGDDTWDAVQTANAQTKWATQRRRGGYGKANSLPW